MDCSKYNINIETLFLMWFPEFWLVTPETDIGKEIWTEYLKSVASGFNELQTELITTCSNLSNYLLPTGQHLSLESLLNDIYDPILRRIFITENDIPATENIWYLEGETDPFNQIWYLQGEVDPVSKIWYLEIETSNKNHFTINIPSVITYDNDILRGEIDPYIVNGYNYNIITF